MLKNHLIPFYKSVPAFAAFLMWLLMAAVGILSIIALRELVVRFYILSLDTVPSYRELSVLAPQGYNQVYWRGGLLTQWTSYVLAILWILVVIGGTAFIYQNVGQPRVWRFLGWAIGLDVLVVGLVLLICVSAGIINKSCAGYLTL